MVVRSSGRTTTARRPSDSRVALEPAAGVSVDAGAIGSGQRRSTSTQTSRRGRRYKRQWPRATTGTCQSDLVARQTELHVIDLADDAGQGC